MVRLLYAKPHDRQTYLTTVLRVVFHFCPHICEKESSSEITEITEIIEITEITGSNELK